MTNPKTGKQNAKLIKPQTLKGFRDFLPEEMKLREYVINTFKKVFERYGYEPLETPALEYSELMLGISGEEAERQFFRFTDRGGRDVMMRFEVMVPMCRAVAQYRNKLTFPFKRYQIQRCWRAEKPQKGRLREFTQCDADTIGSGSMLADAEFIQMGTEAMLEFGFKDFVTRLSNRKFLDGVIKFVGADPSLFYGICMSIDKLRKIGMEKVKKELIEKRKVSPGTADQILEIVSTKGESRKLIKVFKEKMVEIPEAGKGLSEIGEILGYLKTAGVEEKYYQFDPSIARGLAHYTGPIWEVEVIEGGVGSVAGCGRYDNVIGSYLGGKEKIPATGGSFGIERMMEILKDRQMITLPKSYTKILVTVFSPELLKESIKLANQLRAKGINTEIYLDPAKDLRKQLDYANKKGIPYSAILGPKEIKKEQVTIKNMQNGEQQTIAVADIGSFFPNLSATCKT